MKNFDCREGKTGDPALVSPVISHMAGTFSGTTNLWMVGTSHVLLKNPPAREKLDAIAGCSNEPDLILALRRMGLIIPCKLQSRRNSDGRACRFSVYHLTDADQVAVSWWLARRSRR